MTAVLLLFVSLWFMAHAMTGEYEIIGVEYWGARCDRKDFRSRKFP